MKYLELILVVCVILFEVVNSQTPAPNKECTFWNQLAANLSRVHEQAGDFLHMACNSSCSDLRCSGHLKQPPIKIDIPIALDFCFGVRLNNCKKPVTMDYYLSIPSKNISMNGSVSHNDTFETPGPTMVMGARGTVVVGVEMVPVNSSFIMFGITGNVKVTVGGLTMFPYKEQVFPPTLIDVPSCDGTKPALPAFTAPQICVPPQPPVNPSVAPTVVVVKSRTYNKSCELGVTQCGSHEMCQAIDQESKARNGICQCELSSVLSPKTGMCESLLMPSTKQVAATTAVVPSVTQASKITTKSGMNMTAVIIGSVVGGLLLIVVIGTTIVCLGRRKRMAIYRDRHQLLTDDIDDDDDGGNVVI